MQWTAPKIVSKTTSQRTSSQRLKRDSPSHLDAETGRSSVCPWEALEGLCCLSNTPTYLNLWVVSVPPSTFPAGRFQSSVSVSIVSTARSSALGEVKNAATTIRLCSRKMSIHKAYHFCFFRVANKKGCSQRTNDLQPF